MKTERNAAKVKGCTYCRSKGNRNAYSICEYGVGSKRKLMKCRHCGRTYSETYGTLFKGSKLSPSQHREILKLMLSGVSIRSTAALMKLSPATVLRSRKRLESHIDHGLLGMFRDLGFTKVLRKGLAGYLGRK